MIKAMKAKHYVDKSGKYLGAFAGAEKTEIKKGKPVKRVLEARVPKGAVEVPAPPNGKCTWDGKKWSDPPAPKPTIEDRVAALERLILK